MSADAIQGETLEYMVLALPPMTSNWSPWLRDPSRLLTILSRFRWQLVMTYVHENRKLPIDRSRKDPIPTILKLQDQAKVSWTWKSMLDTLPQKSNINNNLWRRWLLHVRRRCGTKAPAQTITPAFQTSSAVTASVKIFRPLSSPDCYRGHRFRIFVYMRLMLRFQKVNPNFHHWLHEVVCTISERRRIMGLRLCRDSTAWFANTFMPYVDRWHERMTLTDGALLSFVGPVSNDNNQLFSAVVYGLSSQRRSHWALGRMEWLAFELVIEARRVLLDRIDDKSCPLWTQLDNKFMCPRTSIDLSVAFAPHKMRLTGEELETAAAGGGGRADILLLAWPKDAAVPAVLGSVYHTTNVSLGTASHRDQQAYPESRLLWRHVLPLQYLGTLAADSLILRLKLAWPEHRDKLNDPETWRRRITSNTRSLTSTSDSETYSDEPASISSSDL